MGKKSDILSGMGTGFEILKALHSVGASDDDLRAILAEGSSLPQEIVALLKGAGETEFVVPLSDGAISENLKKTTAEWRALAKRLGYDGLVAWRVRVGFTLKKHAPDAGPCYQNFQYLQDWKFADEPTRDAIVFWIPRLVPDSTSKTVPEQMALLATLHREFGLPKTHLASFGNPALLVALIFAHYKATGERVPLDCCWVRTDVCHSDGNRLSLGRFGEGSLGCDYWHWGDGRSPSLGVFALGVEALGL